MLEDNNKPTIQIRRNSRTEHDPGHQAGYVQPDENKTKSERWAEWVKIIRN